VQNYTAAATHALSNFAAHISCSHPLLCESMCLYSGGAMMKTDDHIEDNHPHGSICISVCKEQLESIGYDGPGITIVSSKATSAGEKIS